MSTPPLVVVTTRLPPQVCGIGTYSWLLHQHWPDQNARTQFLVIDGAAESATALQLEQISEFSAQSKKLSDTLERVGPADVLLHYAGRAYHRFGSPRWLPGILRNWKTKFPSGRLLIIFHELPANNFPITSRFFWIDACNNRVVRQLADLADAIVTNTREHVAKLERICDRKDIELVPVGSNIEPINISTRQRERTEFAIFGLPFGRWQTLEMFKSDLGLWQQNGRLTKLHLIGPPDEKFDARSNELIRQLSKPEVVVRHGLLSAGDVSKVLLPVQFGLTNATIDNWSKSTAFMAYAAHGCAIVGKMKSELAPICFVIAPEEVPAISDVDLSTRAQMLQQWYRENAGWNVIAAKVAALLEYSSRKPFA
jgi:hypothetical protein